MINESAILAPASGTQQLNWLLMSLESSQDWQPSERVYEFLQDCFTRLSKKGVKYLDDLQTLVEKGYNKVSMHGIDKISVLYMVLMEQWPFMASANRYRVSNACRWILRLLGLSLNNGGDIKLLGRIRDNIISNTEDEECRLQLKEAFREPIQIDGQSWPDEPNTSKPSKSEQPLGGKEEEPSLPTKQSQSLPYLVDDETHIGLIAWRKLKIEDAIKEGAVGQLILCLSSKLSDVRQQSLMALLTFMKTIEVGTGSTSQQLANIK